MDNNIVESLLSTIVDTNGFVEQFSHLFDWSKLRPTQKIQLLMHDKAFYSKYITSISSNATHEEKFQIIIDSSYKEYHCQFELTKQDVLRLSLSDLTRLYSSEYGEKYYYAKAFDKLSDSAQKAYFIKYPFRVHKKMICKLDAYLLYSLCCNDHSSFVIKWCMPTALNILNKPISYHEKNRICYFWKQIINEHPNKSIPLFVKNIPVMRSVPLLREFIASCPEILKFLDIDIMKQAALTPKQWILLLATSIRHDKNRKLEGWSFNADIKKWLKEEAFVDILKGKDKASDPLTRASTLVFA